MADVLLFHHAQGLTEGCLAFAEELRSTGHVVHTPDLYHGNTFDELDDGMAYVRELGFDSIIERGEAAAGILPADLIYAGFSLGVLPAQKLAQTRPGARGAVLMHAAIPIEEFGGSWPDGVPLQIHVMEDDELGDVDIARDVAGSIDVAELFLYPGDGHLFTDSSLPAYDPDATMLLTGRVDAFLHALG